MSSLSKGASSHRKGEAPGKIKIQMKGNSAKVVQDSDEEDLDVPGGVKNGVSEGNKGANDAGKKKREVPARIDTSVLENVSCTACGKQLNPNKSSSLQKHPQLKVVICRRCEKFLNSGEIAKDADGTDEQCRWCGEGGRLVVCDVCSSAFCKACVMRNFNRSEFNNINSQESWKCYMCDKTKLQGLRENYRLIRDTMKALQAKNKAKETAASSSSPSQAVAASSNGKTEKADKDKKPNKQEKKPPAVRGRPAKKVTAEKVEDRKDGKGKEVAGKGKEKEKEAESSKPARKGKDKEEKNGEKVDEMDEMDKEIEKLSKLPTLKAKGATAETAESDDTTKEPVEKKPAKKAKPGPKCSKKKKNDLDELSDDEGEEKDDASSDSEEFDEDEDMQPKVTFLADSSTKDEQMVDEENELAKRGVLEGSNSESADDADKDSSSSDSDLDEMPESKKKRKVETKQKDDKEDEEEDDGEEEEDADSDDSDAVITKKKRISSKLLNTKLDDSGSEEEKELEKEIKKKEDSDPSDSSGSSIESEENEDEEDSMEDEDEDDGEPKKKKKGRGKGKGKRKRKKKGKKGSDDEDEEEEEEGGKKKGKKRRRIKAMGSSDEDEEDKDKEDDDDDGGGAGFGKRKKIRKLMSNKKLEDATKAAARAEEKRRKRISTKQREYNTETITDENNPMNCLITTKLILEPGKEEGDDPVVQVNKKLIRKLKPHQVEAVQFMWDCMFESVKRSKKESGAGCILAHCMGLGKTLSVVTFVHTILSHESALKMRTCLVVSPLNTVLNWRNEWTMWLEKKDQLDVWELASCKQNNLRADQLKQWQEIGGIMIIGYEMYRNLTMGARIKNKKLKKTFLEALVDPGPDMVVCDEGHILKNEKSAVSIAMNRMKTRRRVVLTGTPLQNNLTEYHCMLSFVKPNLLGTRKEFTNRFINPIQNGQCTDSTPRDEKVMKARAHVLHEMLAGCVQRRDYSALTKFLPPKQEYVISVRLADVQIDLYNKYLELSGQGVDGMYNNKGARLFKDYQSLMKIWTHPWVLKLAEIRDELKMKYDDEDSFIDDDSEDDRSFSSSNSDSEEDKKFVSDSGGEGTSAGPSSKKGTRRTRAKARRQAGEDSDPEEVIAEWKSKTRGKDDEDDNGGKPEVEKGVSSEWWAQYVKEDDKSKMELSHKLTLLFEILRMSEEIGDKVLIFSQSILSLNIIEDFLETVDAKFQQDMDKEEKKVKEEVKDEDEDEDKEKEEFGRSWTKNLDYYRMDGSTSAQNRQIWAENFNDVDNYRARLFLISTKAGGLGINLVAANRVIIFDASWNPSHDVQSIFRVYRFGQTKPCYIYRFLAQGSMEEKIYERQVTKLSLSQRVVDEHQIERHFSAADLKELYNFKPEKWDDGAEQPTLALPKDPLLAEILKTKRQCVVNIHEHDSLLENQVEQTLTEEEKKAAWEEYENEKKGIIMRGPGMSGGQSASWPMMAAAQVLSKEQIMATVQALRQQLPDLPEDIFQLHVEQALRRQVQLRQEEMRRLEMLRMQEMSYMMSQGGQDPWMQIQRLRAMQMMQGMGGSYNMMAGMPTHLSNKPEEAINLDESPTKG